MTHTPGPWELRKAHPGAHYNLITRTIRLPMPNTDRLLDSSEGIALQPYNSTSVEYREEYEPNARLIAAAPELLEATQAHLEEWHAENRNFVRKEPQSIKLARKAIAKAEGKQ